VESNRERQANKPALWYLYALALYGTTQLVEVPIAFQLLICAIVCARVLSWMLTQNMWKSFAYCLFFVSLAPSVIHYSSSFYSDGIYAICLSGMLFEIWRCMQNKHVDKTSLTILFITIPFAIFGRPNGFINILPLVLLAWLLAKPHRLRLLAVTVPWLLVGFGSQIGYSYKNPIGTVFPLATFETVGFLEHRPMGLWEHNQPRVTPKTIAALTSGGASLERVQKYYDHYYWDPLVFFPPGPALLGLSEQAKKDIVYEFFKYNLWHNFPAFAASRVNIFLYAAFANGGIPGPTNAQNILAQTQSRSVANAIQLPTDSFLRSLYDVSIQKRVLLWTPWVGFVLLFLGCIRVYQRRDIVSIAVVGTYTLQFLAVFFFSIAGEYRYLLGFFTAPLVLLPLLFHQDRNRNV
jgi:hypothetical protein